MFWFIASVVFITILVLIVYQYLFNIVPVTTTVIP
jgi:hypothetical protein